MGIWDGCGIREPGQCVLTSIMCELGARMRRWCDSHGAKSGQGCSLISACRALLRGQDVGVMRGALTCSMRTGSCLCEGCLPVSEQRFGLRANALHIYSSGGEGAGKSLSMGTRN